MSRVKQTAEKKASEPFRGYDTACPICGNAWDGGGCCPIHVAGRDLAEACQIAAKYLRDERAVISRSDVLVVIEAALKKAGVA